MTKRASEGTSDPFSAAKSASKKKGTPRLAKIKKETPRLALGEAGPGNRGRRVKATEKKAISGAPEEAGADEG